MSKIVHRESILSNFQCYDRKDCQKNPYDPKSGYDLTFVKTLYLIMMVKGRHPENAPSLAKFFFGVLKPANLQHHR